MKKLLLCAAAVLCVAATIFGGYYYFNHDEFQAATTPEEMPSMPSKTPEPTDRNVALQIRGGALRDENGNIDPNGVANAIAQRDLYLAQHIPSDGFGDKGVARGVPSNWLPRGPQNLGGRTETILLHPLFGVYGARYGKTMWAGGASGGIWISSNAGVTWNAVNGVLGNYNVSCLALDPGDPTGKTLYAGTGALDRDGDGIFKSTNGGVDWVPLYGQAQGWKWVSSIAVTRHNDTTIVLAAVDNVSNALSEEHGIMRGTLHPNPQNDTWVKVINAPFGGAVAFDPNDPLRAIASVCYLGDSDDTDDKCKAFYSTQRGEFETWHPSLLELTVTPYPCATPTSFETCRANDSIHFAFRTSGSGTTIYAQYGDATPTVTSKSTNGGISFTSSAGRTPGISRGVPTLWVSEPDPPLPGPESFVVISGGAHLFRSTHDAQFFETEQIANGNPLEYDPVNPHVDMQIAVTDPRGGTNKKVFLATDGGIYHTEDITMVTGRNEANVTPESTPSGWTALNDKLQNTQYFSVAGDARSPGSGSGLIFGGVMDNGSLRLLSGSTDAVWLKEGDGGAVAVDGTYCFGQIINLSGEMFRFDNCASVPSGTPLGGTAITPTFPEPIAGNHLTQIIIDQDTGDDNTDRERAFLGVNAVWRTDNVKTGTPPTWTPIKPNPAVMVTGFPTGSPTPIRPRVTALAVAPSNSNYMWVGEIYPDIISHGLGDLWRSTNALDSTPNWTKVDENGANDLPNRQITKILVDPSNSPNHPDEAVYVAYGGFADNNLWRTINHGDSWEDITGGQSTCSPTGPMIGLPCVPIRAVVKDPRPNNESLNVGTEIGIFVTDNVWATPIVWRPVMHGPADVSVDDLTVIKGTSILLAGTWGRGLWTLNLGPTITPGNALNDFDGDGRSDLAVVRQEDAHKDWHVQGSTEGYRTTEFGNRDDQVAAADYDGDGKTDVAVYRGSEQKFFCLRSSDNTLAVTQIAVPSTSAQSASADFDGDDLADEAVFDPYTGHWTVEQSSNGHFEFDWGEPGDNPAAADFDNDGLADFGVLHEENGMITLSYFSNGAAHEKQFGLEGDFSVPGDYDGDGNVDVAVWRPDDDGEGNGCWYITYAANGYEGFDEIPWGESGDIPAPGDYDGDGKLDIAVFRPSTGMWHMLQSSNGYYSDRFGADGDKPVGVKAVYASRGNQQFTPAPPHAQPRRRNFQTDKSQMTTAD